MVAEKPSYNVKTQIIQDFLRKGSAGGAAPPWNSEPSQGQPQSLSSEGEVELKSDCCVVPALCCGDF